MQMNLNTTWQAGQQMNSTKFSHPGFQSLPKRDKRLLLVSEGRPADQSSSQHPEQKVVAGEIRSRHINAHPRKKPLTFGDFVAGVYRTFGNRRAKAIVQLAIELDVLKFNGKKRYVIC